jgi:hypothetical protein
MLAPRLRTCTSASIVAAKERSIRCRSSNRSRPIHPRSASNARSSASGAGPREERLPAETVVKLLGAAGRSYRFVMPDGRSGRLAGSAVEAALSPVRTTVETDRRPLLDLPDTSGLTAGVAAAGDTLRVLGRFGAYLYVEPPAGPRGWVAETP